MDILKPYLSPAERKAHYSRLRAENSLSPKRKTGPESESPFRICVARAPRGYVPTDCVVCSVAMSSRTAGPMVEETAARRR